MDRSGALVATAAACVRSLAGRCGGTTRPRPPPAARRRGSTSAWSAIGARIGSDDSARLGFVIDGDRGLVVTAAHTVWGARSLKLSTALGVLHGRIVARAPCDDLAVLEVHPRIPGLAALPAAPAGSPARGQLLRSLGRRLADIGRPPRRSRGSPSRTTASAPSEAPCFRSRRARCRSIRRSSRRSPAARWSTQPDGSSAWLRRSAGPATTARRRSSRGR